MVSATKALLPKYLLPGAVKPVIAIFCAFQFPVGISRNLSCSGTGAGGAFSAGFGGGGGAVSAGFGGGGGAVSAGFGGGGAGLGAVSAGFGAGFVSAPAARLVNRFSNLAIFASKSAFVVLEDVDLRFVVVLRAGLRAVLRAGLRAVVRFFDVAIAELWN